MFPTTLSAEVFPGEATDRRLVSAVQVARADRRLASVRDRAALADACLADSHQGEPVGEHEGIEKSVLSSRLVS